MAGSDREQHAGARIAGRFTRAGTPYRSGHAGRARRLQSPLQRGARSLWRAGPGPALPGAQAAQCAGTFAAGKAGAGGLAFARRLG